MTIHTLTAELPDLALLGLVLRDADGIEFLATVLELSRLPVVFISAYGLDETVTRALAPNRVVTYEDLPLEISPKRELNCAALVRHFVKQIRAKLGDDASNAEWILNVRGVGYRMLRGGRHVNWVTG